MPRTGAWKADSVISVSARTEVEYYHDIVAMTAIMPAVVGNDLILVVDMEDVDVLTAEASGVVEPVAAKSDEVAIEARAIAAHCCECDRQ